MVIDYKTAFNFIHNIFCDATLIHEINKFYLIDKLFTTKLFFHNNILGQNLSLESS